jgi:hypothetical protein
MPGIGGEVEPRSVLGLTGANPDAGVRLGQRWCVVHAVPGSREDTGARPSMAI